MQYHEKMKLGVLPTFLQQVDKGCKPSELDKRYFAKFVATFLKIENATDFSYEVESFSECGDPFHHYVKIMVDSEIVHKKYFRGEKGMQEYAEGAIEYFKKNGQMSSEQIHRYLEVNDLSFVPDYQHKFFQTILAERLNKENEARSFEVREEEKSPVKFNALFLTLVSRVSKNTTFSRTNN